MKLKLNGKEYPVALGAREIIRIERETGRSLAANGSDPSLTFVCSAMAAAITAGGTPATMDWVAGEVDMARLEYYSQVVGSLMTLAMSSEQASGNVLDLKGGKK